MLHQFNRLMALLWPAVDDDDHLETSRRRYLVVMSLGLIFGGTVSNLLAVDNGVTRPAVLTWFILLAPYMFIIPPILVGRTGYDVRRVAQIFLTLLFFCGWIAAYSGGGFMSLGPFWLASVPPMAVLTIGMRHGVGYLAAVLVSYVWFRYFPGSLMLVPADILPAYQLHTNFIGLSLLVLGLTIATMIYHHGMANAAESLIQARKAADAGSRAKSEFLANMSHEIRTPLNGVLGMAQALEMRDLGQEERAMVETVHDSGNTLLAILNDVLDLSKIESGKTLLSPADEDFHVILRRTRELFTPLAHEKGLKLQLRVAPDVPSWVHIDAIRIRQCVSNLISNAVKFTEKGGVSVKVSAQPITTRQRRGHLVCVSVTDSGIGIEPDKIGNLFQAFAQADASISRRYGGTGLGLAVARNLARQMGGDITVKSQPGVGSRFTFTFIAREARSARTGREERLPTGVALRLDGIKVLVVDDQMVNRKVARIFLEEAGAEVSEAENGREALAMLETRVPDIMLLDVHMPVMDGLETIRQLRGRGLAGKALPVIALTADAMSGSTEKLLAHGMDAHLPKPVERQEMVRAIRQVLATRRASRNTMRTA